MATTKEFCDSLRELAKKLASGELDNYIIADALIEDNLDEQDRKKVNASYIRTIMNRITDVKEIGTVSITRTDPVEEAPGFKVAINREAKRQVFTKNDIPALEKRIGERIAKRLLNTMPNITDLEGEQLQGAAIGIKRYQDLIKSMVEQGE
ncbi:hypothetical protein HOU20_gp01 [Citrobacter phage Sazh]|uniref:Uncharacterized protein n=1 Tax=Citrobacter phage Sazh TaxID=2315629 RepID=A0A385IPV2_9CAUD|nr:hypothetical protein HOU20_gp01 [Citrobacter phage Sazh]AXY85425.1 hypothetical protein CPT_Sazh_001 [Citrobacter phage Sazh]